MKVIADHWSGPKEMELSDALTNDRSDCSGVAEEAQDIARTCAQLNGRFLAKLVEKNVITLEEAVEISGVYLEVYTLEEAKAKGLVE